MPHLATTGAACYDVYACLKQTETISPGERFAVSTGMAVEVPDGYLLSVRPRSGLAIKNGITMINSPGTIDCDYRGEVKILLVNHGKEAFEIKDGDRIGQLILEKSYEVDWVEVDELSDTARGEGGFGSTGKA